MRQLRLILLLPVLFVSCKVAFSPQYNKAIEEQVLRASNSTDLFYAKLQAASNRSYTLFSADYATIQRQMDSVVISEAQRSKNAFLAPQATSIQKRFTTYETEHKIKGTVNAAEVSIYARNMHDAWRTLINSENALK